MTSIPNKRSDNHIYLVDGSGFIFRAFHALPPMTRPDGAPINAVYGFTNMLLKLLDTVEADHLVVVFDAGRKTFRNEIYAEYKAHRPPPPDELIPQFPLIRDACKAFNVPTVELAGYEADDIIATYAEQAVKKGLEVTIVSSDKDLMQLVSNHVAMFDPLKNVAIDFEKVMEKFGVGPDKVVDILALAGDSVDNVPGVPGIGVKTAAELINQYGDLETLLKRAGEIKQPKRRERLTEHADDARLSKRLVILKKDVPLELSLDEFVKSEPEEDVLTSFLEAQNFQTIISRLQKRKAASVVKPEPKYQLVQTLDELQAWIDQANKIGCVAINTHSAELVGISLAVTPGEACYIPLGHKSNHGELFSQKSNGQQIPLKQALECLRPLLNDPAVMKIGHNIKQDILTLAQYDVDITPIDDIMVLSYVIYGASHRHDLRELAKVHLDVDTIDYKQVVGTGKTAKVFAQVELEQAYTYAAEYADITLQVYNILKQQLVNKSMVTVYETMDRPLIPVLAQMERWGVAVDVGELKSLSRDFTKRLAELEIKIYKLAGREFNIASPKQLGEVLFHELKLPGGRKGKEGAYSTSADILEGLVAKGHELPAKVLNWRQLAKLKTTYTDALVKQINPKTGRIHTSYGMTDTTTGRLSSSNPNLQNIPVRSEEGRKIRHAFIPKPGWKLVALDYSQIEIRLLAHIGNIDALRKAFNHGADIHARSASEVFGVPIEQVDSELRRRAKVINFGIIYGITPLGLASRLGITEAKAAEYIKDYLKHYPGIHDYMEKMKALARKQGYVESVFGRHCPTPDVFHKIPSRRNFAERQAINAPLQSTSADIIKRAMVRIPAALQKAGLSSRMLLQVHDELIFEAPEAEVDQTVQIARKLMETAAYLSIKLVVDVGIGSNWADTD